jgi:hypothetical protein
VLPGEVRITPPERDDPRRDSAHVSSFRLATQGSGECERHRSPALRDVRADLGSHRLGQRTTATEDLDDLQLLRGRTVRLLARFLARFLGARVFTTCGFPLGESVARHRDHGPT